MTNQRAYGPEFAMIKYFGIKQIYRGRTCARDSPHSEQNAGEIKDANTFAFAVDPCASLLYMIPVSVDQTILFLHERLDKTTAICLE